MSKIDVFILGEICGKSTTIRKYLGYPPPNCSTNLVDAFIDNYTQNTKVYYWDSGYESSRLLKGAISNYSYFVIYFDVKNIEYLSRIVHWISFIMYNNKGIIDINKIFLIGVNFYDLSEKKQRSVKKKIKKIISFIQWGNLDRLGKTKFYGFYLDPVNLDMIKEIFSSISYYSTKKIRKKLSNKKDRIITL